MLCNINTLHSIRLSLEKSVSECTKYILDREELLHLKKEFDLLLDKCTSVNMPSV